MKIMGLDLGNKTLGVAISDSLEMFSLGYPTIRFKNKDYSAAIIELKKLVSEHNIGKFVLGLPLNMDGTEGVQAVTSRNFKKMLEDEFHLEVVLLDERLTTRMGLSNMIESGSSRKERHDDIDQAAARVILQLYLDKERNK